MVFCKNFKFMAACLSSNFPHGLSLLYVASVVPGGVSLRTLCCDSHTPQGVVRQTLASASRVVRLSEKRHAVVRSRVRAVAEDDCEAWRSAGEPRTTTRRQNAAQCVASARYAQIVSACVPRAYDLGLLR